MASGRHLLAVLVIVSFLSATSAQNDFLTQVDPEEGGFSLPGCSNQKMDIFLLLDTSENEAAFQALKTVANNLVQFANPDSGLVRIGVIAYSTEISRLIDLSEFSRTVDLVSAINSLKFRPGQRNTAGALQAMRQLFSQSSGDRKDAPNMAVLLTTGNSVLGVNEVSKEARQVRDQGVHMFAVGVGVTDEREINDIVSSPSDGTKFLVDNIADLAFLPDIVFAQMCMRSQSRMAGELRDAGPGGLTVDMSRKLDVTVVFHASTKLSVKQMNKILKPFLQNLFNKSEIDSGQVRVALGYFSKNFKLAGNLLKYKTKANYTDAVMNLPKTVRGKKVNGGVALKKIRFKVFKKKLGDRPGAGNVILLITDEKTNVKPESFPEEAETLHESGTKIVTLGIGKADEKELKAVATKGKNTFMASGYEDLSKDTLTEELRIAMYTPPPPVVEELLSPGPTVTNLDTREADVAVLFHLTPKLKIKDLKKLFKPFLLRLFQFADIDGGKVRIGMGYFKKRLKLLFNLKKIQSRSDYAKALSTKITKKVRGKKGDAGLALKKMRDRVFSRSRGDRPGVQNVIVIITDDKDSGNQFLQEAEETRNFGIKVVTFGLNKADQKELLAASSEPRDKNMIYAPKYSDMQKEEVVDAVRSAMFAFENLPAEEPTRAPVPQSMKSVSDSRQVDVAVMFHAQSGTSVGDIDNYLKPFIRNLFRYADIDGGNVRVAVSYFRKNPTHVFPLRKHRTRASFQQAVNGIPSRRVRGKRNDGGAALAGVRTNVFDARRGDRRDVPNAVIFITDNKVNISPQKLRQEAAALKAAGSTLITVGVGKANRAELRSAASDPQVQNSFYFDSYASLGNDASAEAVRSRIYGLQDLPPPTRAPPPTTTKAPVVSVVDLSRSNKADLVFAVHFNPSSSEEDFKRMIRWLQGLVRSADMDSGNVRIGLYVDDQYMPFQLNSFQSSVDLAETLDSLPKVVARSRRFNLVNTLRNVREKMFTEENGDRPDVPNGLIIITDTTSRDDRRRVQGETREMAEAGIGIYTVGVGLADKGEMETVASSPRNVFAASDYRELESNVHSVRGEIKALGPAGDVVTPSKYRRQVNN